jgi:hypothetical protein
MIRIKKQTRWYGQTLKPGDPVPEDLSDSVISRWLSKGIAKMVTETVPSQEDIVQSELPDAASSPAEGAEYDGMTVKELRVIAETKSVDVPKGSKKTDIVKLISASDARRAGDND